ncbi:MAG: TlyA family RNA methyltransferase [Chloroflexi bacterium]|nr:TlyA family RNA methyltransferase [Chloroflexota bacterium]
MVAKRRVDQVLVDFGLAADLEEAKRLVMAAKVLSRGQLIKNPSQLVGDEDDLALIPDPKFVSRGGEKLQAAFDHFPLTIDGKVCADIGASTGGFTDCLLQSGAALVFAIDVGYGILDWRIRNHPQVEVLERTNARSVEKLPDPVDFFTMDVSFISLKKILPAASGWFSKDGGQAVVLVKPQFEATKEEAAKGSGVIQDPEIHQRILREVLGFAADYQYQTLGLIRSPLYGPAGNTEFLAWLEYPGENNEG